MNKKYKMVLGAVIIGALLIYLAAVSFSSSLAYYLTVSEVISRGESIYGENINVNGTVVNGSINWSPENLSLTFELTDGMEKMKVIYNGSKPNNFGENMPVVVTGHYTSGKVFEANQITLKCPSKYAADEEY
ncbi:MAG: cytochrome c maturation protein CcmE [Methanosarcinales archaeon]